MKTIKVEYAQEKNGMYSRKIVSYKVLPCNILSLMRRPALLPMASVCIQDKDYLDDDNFVPLSQLNEDDVMGDEDFVQRISRNGKTLELTEKAFEAFVRLFENDNAYIYDEWSDIPSLRLGHG